MPALHRRAHRRYHATTIPVTPAAGLVTGAPRSTDWHNDAACREVGLEMFFDMDQLSAQAAQAKAICADCPVRAQCLEWALSFDYIDDEYGIFGGTGPAERRRLRRQRRQEVAA